MVVSCIGTPPKEDKYHKLSNTPLEELNASDLRRLVVCFGFDMPYSYKHDMDPFSHRSGD